MNTRPFWCNGENSVQYWNCQAYNNECVNLLKKVYHIEKVCSNFCTVFSKLEYFRIPGKKVQSIWNGLVYKKSE